MVTTNSTIKYENIKLSIQVRLDGLSFCGLDQPRNSVVFFRTFNFERKLNPIEVLQQIEKIYKKEAFLASNPGEVIVLFSNELYSMVPEKLFREESASDYLKFNTKILETDFVAQDYLEGLDLVNVYVPYTNINNFFFDKYGEFEYRHDTSVLVEALLRRNVDPKEGIKFFLNNHSLGYDLVVIRDGELLFVNSFTSRTKEDFIYFLLFTAEQLELDPASFDLILLGNISRESDNYKMAYTYIRNIDFLTTSFGYVFEEESQPPQGYKFYTLLKSAK